MKARTCGNCLHGCRLLGRGQIQCKNSESTQYLKDVRYGWEIKDCYTDPKTAAKNTVPSVADYEALKTANGRLTAELNQTRGELFRANARIEELEKSNAGK